jgi:hypothetical protein
MPFIQTPHKVSKLLPRSTSAFPREEKTFSRIECLHEQHNITEFYVLDLLLGVDRAC